MGSVAVPLDNNDSCLSTVGGDSLPGGSDSGRASGTEDSPVAQRAGIEERGPS